MCMHSHADHEHEGPNRPNSPNGDHAGYQSFWRSKAAMVMIGFGIVAAFFLVSEHWAHLYGWLPFLFILACPLMHIFMHHGHGSHGDHGDHDVGGHHDHGRTDPQNKPLPDKGTQP